MTQRKELVPVDLEALEEVDGGWGRRYGYRPRMMGGGGWGSAFFGSFLGASIASLVTTPQYAVYPQPQAPGYGPPATGPGAMQPARAQPVVVQSRPLMELALGSFRFSLG